MLRDESGTRKLLAISWYPSEHGAAAKEVAEALHAHFESEEAYALPPLGLLPALAAGKVNPEMAQVFKMTDTLKAELPHMLDEHQAIVAALKKLIEAAKQEMKLEHVALQKVDAARSKRKETYPTAILIDI
jgi:hypothetical protein